MKKKTAPKSLLWKIAHDAEVVAIRAAIDQHGSRQSAAKSLGISTMTLRTILSK